MGVDLRRRDVGMAEELLHRAQIGATLEEMAGKSVAENVRRDARGFDPGGRAAPSAPVRSWRVRCSRRSRKEPGRLPSRPRRQQRPRDVRRRLAGSRSALFERSPA
jgi:hypothetical protein